MNLVMQDHDKVHRFARVQQDTQNSQMNTKFQDIHQVRELPVTPCPFLLHIILTAQDHLANEMAGLPNLDH
jgi:hypothetical protein